MTDLGNDDKKRENDSNTAVDFTKFLTGFDPKQAAEELERRIERTQQLCAALRDAKTVSQSVLDLEVSI